MLEAFSMKRINGKRNDFLWIWFFYDLINPDPEINEGNDEIGTVPGENWQKYFSNDIQLDGSNEVSYNESFHSPLFIDRLRCTMFSFLVYDIIYAFHFISLVLCNVI